MVHDVVPGAGSSPVTHMVGPVFLGGGRDLLGSAGEADNSRIKRLSVLPHHLRRVALRSTVMKSGCTWAASGPSFFSAVATSRSVVGQLFGQKVYRNKPAAICRDRSDQSLSYRQASRV